MKSGIPPGYRMRANWNLVTAVTAFTGESAARARQTRSIETATIANPRLKPKVLENHRETCVRLPTIACPGTKKHLSFHARVWDLFSYVLHEHIDSVQANRESIPHGR